MWDWFTGGMVTLADRTADDFPFTWARDYVSEQPPLPSSWYAEPHLHRFRLVITRSSLDAILSARIVLNQTIYPMQLGGSSGQRLYYFFDSPNPCTQQYNYRFIVRSHYLLSRKPFVDRYHPPLGSVISAGVTLFGRISWFREYTAPIAGAGGSLVFDEFNQRIQRVYIQNLTPAQVAIAASGLGGGDPPFSTDFPSQGVQLSCGGSRGFFVWWNANRPNAVNGEQRTLMFTVRDAITSAPIEQIPIQLGGIFLGG